jgi:hypothetical protein|tara:strand:- start:3498 stop:3659 length:162 start_codon:yes stop_codon:yes gene_type:complete
MRELRSHIACVTQPYPPSKKLLFIGQSNRNHLRLATRNNGQSDQAGAIHSEVP